MTDPVSYVKGFTAECGNPECHSATPLIDALNEYGAIFLHGPEDGIVGFVCPACKKCTLFECDLETLSTIKLFFLHQPSPWQPLLSVAFKYHSFPYKPMTEYYRRPHFWEEILDVGRFGSVGEDEIDPEDLEHISDLYCSYSFGDEVIGPLAKLVWTDKEMAFELVHKENQTNKRILPRYIPNDLLIDSSDRFCWDNKLIADVAYNTALVKGLDIIESLFTPKKDIALCFQFLSILDAEPIDPILDKTRAYFIANPTAGDVIKTRNSPDANYNKKRKHLKYDHFTMIDEIWSTFFKPELQGLLLQLQNEFIDQYIGLTTRLDFCYDDVRQLKDKYLDHVFEAARSIRAFGTQKRKSVEIDFEQVRKAEKLFPNVKIISQDWRMNQIKIRIADLAPAQIHGLTFLILGERGTGKELFAAAIHEASGRKGKFVKADLGSLSGSLIETTLFGHKKGAFTGAVSDKIGLFELANGGTIFLDEVGNLPIKLQPNLLSVLQNYEVRPVGSDKIVKLDIRIILATNKDLAAEVENGNFMADLYDRFKRPALRIPPLRERPGDIPWLIDFFISKYDVKRKESPDLVEIKASKGATDLLMANPPAGNVREVESIIKTIMASRATSGNRDEISAAEIAEELDEPMATAPKPSRIAAKMPGNTRYTDDDIIQAMKNNNYNKTHAARLLEADPKTIRDRWKRILKDRPELGSSK